RRSRGGGRHVAEPVPARTGVARLGRGIRKSLPFVVASAMTVSLNFTGPVQPAGATPKKPSKPKANFGSGTRKAPAPSPATTAAATPIPAVHTVAPGDTVASIAARYGIATASVLAANGLGWKSQIFPGQELKLTTTPSAPPPSAITSRSAVLRAAAAPA